MFYCGLPECLEPYIRAVPIALSFPLRTKDSRSLRECGFVFTRFARFSACGGGTQSGHPYTPRSHKGQAEGDGVTCPVGGVSSGLSLTLSRGAGAAGDRCRLGVAAFQLK